MPTWRIAVVPTDPAVDFDEVRRVCDAIQRQVAEDFASWWGIQGTIAPRRQVEDVPDDYFIIQLVSQLDNEGLEGFHYFDSLGQPHALVRTNNPDWSLTVSHECLEMLADPTGNYTVPGPHPDRDGVVVDYLQEVCDPCQHRRFAYRLNDRLVSDFYGPQFFDTSARPNYYYSITRSIMEPRQILPGGYICFRDVDGQWWRRSLSGNGQISTKVTASIDLYQYSIREQIDADSKKHGWADPFSQLPDERLNVNLNISDRGESQRGDKTDFTRARASLLLAFRSGKRIRKRSQPKRSTRPGNKIPPAAK